MFSQDKMVMSGCFPSKLPTVLHDEMSGGLGEFHWKTMNTFQGVMEQKFHEVIWWAAYVETKFSEVTLIDRGGFHPKDSFQFPKISLSLQYLTM